MDNLDPKYFDYAASCPPFTEALEKFTDISRKFFANPSAIHGQGRQVTELMNEQKKRFCDLLNFSDGRLLLCSSATEANNTVIEGFIHKYPTGRILIAEDVHDSVWYAVQKYPAVADVLKIDADGSIRPESLLKAVTKGNMLVCFNHVCNETGTIHNVARIGAICHANNIKLLIDGTQAIGHIPIDMNNIPFNYYTFSAHRFGGVRSMGGIMLRDEDFIPLIRGGRQEWNLRGGTENVAGLGAAVAALTRCLDHQNEEIPRLTELKHDFMRQIRGLVPGVLVNTPEISLPGLLSLSFMGCKGNEIVTTLSLSGFSASTGSACHANQVEPSRIIQAIWRNKKKAIGAIRISMGYGTTQESVDALLEALVEYVRK